MGLIYQLIIGTNLPKKKVTFDCQCKMRNFVKQFLKKYAKKLSKSEIECSINLVRIDDEKLPDYKGLFPDKDTCIQKSCEKTIASVK